MKIKTSTQAKAIKTPGRHSAGEHGLYLNVTEGGGKSWVQRLTIDGRRHNIGLGSSSGITQKARDKAFLNHNLT